MRKVLVAILILFPTLALRAQSLHECHTVYIEVMPEFLDRFLSAEIVKLGKLRVVVDQDKAECALRFPRAALRTEIQSTGSVTVPRETAVGSEIHDRLPSSTEGGGGGVFGPWGGVRLPEGDQRMAAVDLIHMASGTVVWADSKTNVWTTGGAKELARKLSKQLHEDYQKAERTASVIGIEATAGSAILYVFRRKGDGNASEEPPLLLNGREIARMDNGRYIQVSVPPGRHTFSSDDANKPPITLVVEEGTAYYLEMKASAWKGVGHLQQVTEFEAKQQLPELKALSNKFIRDKSLVVSREY